MFGRRRLAAIATALLTLSWLAAGNPSPSAAAPSSAASASLAAASASPDDRVGVDLTVPADQTGSASQPAIVPVPGVGWMRLTVNWDRVEPVRGEFKWTSLDAVVRQATAKGTHILLTVQRTPRWAALTPDTPEEVWSHQPPRALENWSFFLHAIATRYRGRVAAWQIEPVLEFRNFRGTTRDYLEMLHAARVELKRADPGAIVVAATPSGLDLPFMKLLLTRSGGDFDAMMLYPRNQTAGAVLEALGTFRTRSLITGRHEIWMDARTEWPQPLQLAVAALVSGVAREFWVSPTRALLAVLHALGGMQFIGSLDRGPGVYAYVFARGEARTAVLWTGGPVRTVSLAPVGGVTVTDAAGRPVPLDQAGTVSVGADPLLVTGLDAAVVDEASKSPAAGPLIPPREPGRDFSRAESVSAILGAVNIERGLYNEELRALPSGGVVPVTVDGVSAVRTNQSSDAVYVYFTIDDSYAYFVDGRYDYVITVEVHRSTGPQRVGFNLMYDSMSGYRFSPWQWVDAGDGWGSYTVRITDASFSKTWGWDFAVNGAGDKRENLIVRSVTVKRVPAGQQLP